MWRSVLLSFISGLLLAISWPTNGFAGFLFIAFVPLLIIEHQFTSAPFKRKALRIFFLSFISFIIWNSLSYFWLSHAMPQSNATAQEIQQAWIAYLFPVIVNSLLMSLVFLLYHFIKKSSGNFIGLIFLPCIWMTFEKLHLNWDFAWPWLNLGNGFASYYKWVQWYDVTGAFGGTLWVWLTNISSFIALNAYLERKGKKKILKNIIIFSSILILPIISSYIIYNSYEEQGKPINITVLQPSLDPYKEKYSKDGEEILNDLLNLAESNSKNNPNFILGPETALPGMGQILTNEYDNDFLIKQIRNYLSENQNTVFVSGVDLGKVHTQKNAPNPYSINYGNDIWVNRYNGVIQLENGIKEVKEYHKSKLVVGVELFPYSSILKPLLGDVMLDFGGSTNSLTIQDERTVFKNTKNEAIIAPIVCYESVFGEFTSDFVKNGANILFISTNDSWWGNTDGHKQFLDYARLRAIENRRSIARSANSGTSAFINQRGDVVKSLPYDKKGSLNHTILMNNSLTNYSVAGDLIARISLFISGVLIAFYFAELLLKKKQINEN